MKEALYNVLRAPLISEKTARLQESNQYVFEIAQGATKADGTKRKAYVRLGEGQSIDVMAKA